MSDHEFSVRSAQAAAERDELDEWVARFLASPGSDNAELAKLLSDPPRHWIGPVRLRFDQLHRLAGPPGDPVLETWDEDDWRDDVEDLAEKIDEDDLEPPPVVVSYRKEHDHLVLEDGNHRVEALRRAGEEDTWGIVAFEDVDDRDRFLARADRVDQA